jgi:hypothetical protein
VSGLPAPEETLHGFGRWLTRERDLRCPARGGVARATKLAPGVVEALESGDEARMPPRAYVVGYLRAYAGAVGLDADEVVLRYEETAAPSQSARTRGQARPGLRTVAIALAIGAAIGAVVFALLR